MNRRIALTSYRPLKALLQSRYPQLVILVVMLAGYLFAIMAGLIGSPVGSSNFSVVFVWIAWWALLILIAVPWLGRSWCSICPIPVVGEWMQRGAVLGPLSGANRLPALRWPRSLRNIWLQSASFLLLALFSTVLLTTPLVTSIVLAGMLLAATGLSLLFERRAFCRHVCPVGGFIGLYSQAAPLELRIMDKAVCVACDGKPCYNGSKQGFGCPWDVFPGGMTRNTYCGLCMECLRTCPKDNIAINLRPFAADLQQPTARLDEAFKAFVMLGAAIIYSAVLLGPWGALKEAAFQIGTSSWLVYAASVLTLVGVLLPGIFALCTLPAPDGRTLRQRFSRMSTALIPLGLTAWIAFSLALAMTNASYILPSLSDPLNLGWDLLGVANLPWQPLLTAGVAPLQAAVLAGGIAWSARVAQRAAARLSISPIPAMAYCAGAGILMMWLLL